MVGHGQQAGELVPHRAESEDDAVSDEVTDVRTVPLYRRGRWSEVPDPLPEDWAVHHDRALETAGYDTAEGTSIGRGMGLGGGQMALEVFVNVSAAADRLPKGSAAAGFALLLKLGGYPHLVLAGDVVDVMDLLHRWCPVIQQWKVTELLDQLDETDLSYTYSADDLVATLAARAAHGVHRRAAWEEEALAVRGDRAAADREARARLGFGGAGEQPPR